MEAKIAALEEEISILKGEIKSILQEVRTAVLASENPFTGGAALRTAPQPVAASPLPDVAPETRVIQLVAPPTATPPPASPDRDGRAGPAPELDPPDWEQAPTTLAEPRRPTATYREPRMEIAAAPESALGYAPRMPDVRALAALLTWVEETRERLDVRRYTIVLGLARYGGLLDPDLQATLTDAGEIAGGIGAQERASVNDCIVALRQLEAILAPGPAAIRPLYQESEGLYREVRPSRRQ